MDPQDTQWPPRPFDVAWRTIAECQAWWVGDPSRLTSTYGGNTARQDHRGLVKRLFWGRRKDTGGSDGRRVHIPIAADLAATSANLLLSDPASWSLPHEQDDPGGKGQDRIDLVFNTASQHSRMQEAAESCAALGGVFPYVVWDRDVADHVWIDYADADQAIPEFSYGRLKAVTFWRVLDSDSRGNVLRHLERHEPGRIYHALRSGTTGDLGRLLPLADHPETEGIPVNEDGYVPTGTGRLTASYVPNIRPNPAWRNKGVLRYLGRSDLADPGVVSLMDLIDETYSSLARDVRLAKARLIVSEQLLDTRGPGKGSVFDVDQEAFTAVAGAPNADPVIEAHQFGIRVDEHLRTADAYLREILRRVGYSPGTFGMPDRDGAAMTATEVDAHERRSVATHKAKSGYWLAGHQELSLAALDVDANLFGTGVHVDRIDITWPPPVRESALARAQTVQALDNARAVSTETKVAMQWPEWDHGRRDEEVARIHQEQRAETGDFDPMTALAADGAPDQED